MSGIKRTPHFLDAPDNKTEYWSWETTLEKEMSVDEARFQQCPWDLVPPESDAAKVTTS